MKFIDSLLKKLKINKKKRKSNIIFNPTNSSFKRRKKKKFSFFKVNFNFRDISLSDYYNRGNNHYIYYFIIGFILTFLSIYAFFFSDYFNINKIIISEKDNDKSINIVNIDFAYSKLDKFKYKSIFFVDNDKIKKQLKNSQNTIKTVKIRRLFPRTLKIDIIPYKIVFKFKIGDKNFLVLKNGSLVPSNKGDFLEVEVFDKTLKNRGILDYKKIFETKDLLYIKFLYDNVKNNIGKQKITKIMFFPIEREIHLVLDNKNILIFSIGKNIKEQIEKALIFKKLKKEEFLNNYYIDTRIAKKIFYCSRKFLGQCKKNYKEIYELEDKDLVFEVKKQEKKEKEKKN